MSFSYFSVKFFFDIVVSSRFYQSRNQFYLFTALSEHQKNDRGLEVFLYLFLGSLRVAESD